MQQGANASLPASRVTVTVDWPKVRDVDVDAGAYLLTAGGRVRGDRDMVFYNQPEGERGAVRLTSSMPGRGAFEVDTDLLPDEVDRVVFCLTVHDPAPPARSLRIVDGASIALSTAATGDALHYRPALAEAREAAITFGEIYRRSGSWKFRAVGQGFNGGLTALARSFGLEIRDGPAVRPGVAPAPSLAPTPRPVPPVRLTKVTLEKRGQAVSLEKKGVGFGEIVVNLNWSRGRQSFFGGGAIDLDLGCLYELANGEKQAVQALGRAFGKFDAPPYIALSDDDRTGDAADGETLRINGARWNEIRRVLVFANIYEGAPNWQRTDGVVLVTMPDQPPIEVRLTDGTDRRMCGIVLLENDGGRLSATRVVEYFDGHRSLDKRYGWGLRWVGARKD